MNYEFCDGMTHTIKKGDTLYSISRQHNVPIAMIMRANPYVDVYNLQIGETICIPVMERQSDIGRNMGKMPLQFDTGRNIDEMPQSDTQRNTDGISPQPDMQRNTGGISPQPDIQRDISGMSPQPDMSGSSGDMSKYPDTMCEMDDSSMSGEWTRYVSQPGDTLQDIIDRSESGEDEFFGKNPAERMYMLPGISYYIYEKQ